MNKIIIDCDADTIKTAVIDEKGLVELIIDKCDERSLVGNIYAGVVKNILPNQFAFVDIGYSKNGFLFLNDKKESLLYSPDKKLTIKPGDALLVQVVKDETGSKGAYVTSQIFFPGRLCVLLKTGFEKAGVSISKKITAEAERKRLKSIVLPKLPTGYDLIIRTNCLGKPSEEIESELNELLEKSEEIESYWKFLKAPCVVNYDENIVRKNLKDLFNQDTDEVVINSSVEAENAKNAVKSYFHGAEDRIKLFANERDIFDYYCINSEIRKIHNKKVWLNSGGFIIIEQTEACFVIDVNSGKFLGKKNHEQSTLNLNIEACKEIARQMRLRNLSGIIIVDFIDMKSEESKEILKETFAAELRKDRISANVIGMTSLGLMEVTRKKTREPLCNILGENSLRT